MLRHSYEKETRKPKQNQPAMKSQHYMTLYRTEMFYKIISLNVFLYSMYCTYNALFFFIFVLVVLGIVDLKKKGVFLFNCYKCCCCCFQCFQVARAEQPVAQVLNKNP